MREFTVVFEEGIRQGLKPNNYVPHRKQWLQQALGLIPEDEVLQTLPQLPEAITTLGCTYPFPQIFKLKHMVLVCDARVIYTYENSSLTVEYVAPAAGTTWSVADFDDYVVLTNGRHLITRDPRNGVFGEFTDCEIPTCLCLLNLNGQLLVGGPGCSVSAGFTGE